MENESDKLTETGFRRWVITNFSELKEHVLTQCKETKNLEKSFDEMLMRINRLERNINELMELKNTDENFVKNRQVSIAESTKQKKGYQTEDQFNEIKREGKIGENRVKKNEQSLQETWDYVKRPNLCLIGVPECDREN